MKTGKFFSHRIRSFLDYVPCPAAGFLIVIFLSACGLRADPVAPSPYDDNAGRENVEKVVGNRSGPEETHKSEVRAEPLKDVRMQPNAPSGVTGVYTNTAVILTWDEMIGQGIILYRVYRSEGGDYILAGESMAPAFTDSSIEKKREYYYKITAMGKSEGPPSEEFKVVTETQ